MPNNSEDLIDKPIIVQRQKLSSFLKPSCRRAIMQLVTTAGPFFGCMAVMLTEIQHGRLIFMLTIPVSAMLLVRLFMFQHDCGHGSFFASCRANNLVGCLIGILTLTPYTSWRLNHAVHHASAGNLDRRGIGDVTTLTLGEYRALPNLRRLAYRLYRHPLVMFGLGPIWLFFISNRIPTSNPRENCRDWLSILGTNIAIGILLGMLIHTVGLKAVLFGWLPVLVMAATIGVWLFYVQHQFKNAYWQPQSNWNFETSALQGASFYDLPIVLHWCTGNIGYHHIHHLSSKVPNYRLRQCHEANPAFHTGPRLTLLTSLKCASLGLWDSETCTLIPFKQ